MTLKVTTVTFILLATFSVGKSVRMRPQRSEERGDFEMQLQTETSSGEKEGAIEEEIGSEVNAPSASDWTGTYSAGTPVSSFGYPAAFVQEEASEVSSPPDTQPSIIPNFFTAKKHNVARMKAGSPPHLPPPVSPVPPPPASSSFAKTLDYVNRAHGPSRGSILKAACDSSAFSCDEIIQLAISLNEAILFAEARNNTGCISDPANAKSIRDAIETTYPSDFRPQGLLLRLDRAFIDNEALKPASDVEPQPVRPQASHRAGEDMKKLLGDMKDLQLVRSFGVPGTRGAYRAGSPAAKEFESWLRQIRAQGEQFSGPQLVALVEAIPKAPSDEGYYTNSGTSRAVAVLLQSLEQYVTGVTCAQVNQIIRWMIARDVWRYGFAEGFDALKSNIVDGSNKVDIIASTDSLNLYMVQGTELALQDIGVGLPPKNNPIFGVVRGNPVILVVDESTAMDDNFTLGTDKMTRRKFCNSQLDTVLAGLPNGTYFNVIRYSSSAVKIFQEPVLANEATIEAAMQAVGITWRSSYEPGRDPVRFLQHIKLFALKVPSVERNSLKALQLAYATADLPIQEDDKQHDVILEDVGIDTELVIPPTTPTPTAIHPAQIYFMTSGQPEGGANEILQRIDEFDRGRNIPVNSIAFIEPADLVAKQFVKDLAQKTSGFLRSIEQASLNVKTSRRNLVRALFPTNRHSMKTRRK